MDSVRRQEMRTLKPSFVRQDDVTDPSEEKLVN